jgi:histidyl-tRNA synthetase
MRQAARLRTSGIGVIQTTGDKSLKAQLRQANTMGAVYTVILGEEELKSGNAIVRNMATAQQETVPLDKLVDSLKIQ